MSQQVPQQMPQYPGQGAPMQAPPKKKTGCGTIAIIILACSIPVIGIVAALGIYGVRRYLSSAKASEAKNTVSAIGRGMVAAYEQNEKLCGPAQPVPAAVPAGTKYQPSMAAGQDYERGSPTEGWPCLKFSMVTPQYYQYEVRVGTGYKGPARGGVDPGPDGFEISAVGDLDADGQTSLFILTGKVDAAAKRVVLSPTLFVADEFE